MIFRELKKDRLATLKRELLLNVLDPVDRRIEISSSIRSSRRNDNITPFGLYSLRCVSFDNEIIILAASALSVVELDASSIIRRLEAREMTGE